MKIIVAGGSGQIGSMLARAHRALGNTVITLSRSANSSSDHAIFWDGKTLGAWTKHLEGADAVINLAGRTVNCRYTTMHRREILDSRIDSTNAIGQAIATLSAPPKVWLQASTATIYAHRYDAPNDEISGKLGTQDASLPDTWNFSTSVAHAWEAAALAATHSATRLVIMRAAMVMSADRGGVFDTLLQLVRLGLGGASGDGKQFVSWIHGEDFLRAVNWVIQDDSLSGAINFAAPAPVPNKDFMATLRESWGIGIGLPAPKPLLEIGALMMQTESELVLKSRRVVPRRLLEAGFAFTYPTWPAAARALCAEWRMR